jgi:hypothetical protein
LPQTILGDFAASFADTPSRIATSQSNASQSAQSMFGAGVVISSHKVLDARVKSLAIPLSYTVRNDIDPRRQAMLRGTVGIVDSAGTRSYQGRFSAGYRFPMSDQWTITPMGGLSFAGSRDAVYALGIFNGSVASTYTWELDGIDITMGNMLGYYHSFKLPINFTTDPRLRVVALVNGVFISQPVSFGDRRLSIEYGLADSRLSGTKLYQKDSQELTISLGTNKSAMSARSYLRATLALQRAKDSKGASLSVNYWF